MLGVVLLGTIITALGGSGRGYDYLGEKELRQDGSTAIPFTQAYVEDLPVTYYPDGTTSKERFDLGYELWDFVELLGWQHDITRLIELKKQGGESAVVKELARGILALGCTEFVHMWIDRYGPLPSLNEGKKSQIYLQRLAKIVSNVIFWHT